MNFFIQQLFVDPPQFLPPPSSTVVGVEGESLQVSMKANANPMTIIYTWTKDSQPIAASNSVNKRIMSEGPILNITKLERGDAGVYTCRAKNAQGKSEINVTIVVECEYYISLTIFFFFVALLLFLFLFSIRL